MFLYIIIFIAELVASYLADYRNVSVVARKKLRAVSFDTGASILNWIMPWIIFVVTQDWTLMIPSVIGSALGTYLVSGRKLKKKKAISRKKFPVSTA